MRVFSRLLNRHVVTLNSSSTFFVPSSFQTSYPPPAPFAMSSRIHIARPASGGYQPDPHGFANTRPSSGYRAANPDEPIEKLRAFAHTVEDNIDIYTQPLKPHLPAIGRFLIVVTFLEDSLRIVSQWSDQLWYLQRFVSSTFHAVLVYSHSPPGFADTGTSHGAFRISSWH